MEYLLAMEFLHSSEMALHAVFVKENLGGINFENDDFQGIMDKIQLVKANQFEADMLRTFSRPLGKNNKQNDEKSENREEVS